MNKPELIYLASPYTHRDPLVRELRFRQVSEAAGWLMAQGLHVFAPICHSHPIVAACPEHDHGWDYWEEYGRRFLEMCDRLVILRLDGWEQSKGIAGEIAIAKELNMDISHMDPEES